jgi:hypothetical protein
MARRTKSDEPGDWLFPQVAASSDADDQSSLLDVLDNVLNRGAVLGGDVVLGVANVDLIYVKLSVLLAAMDKVAKNDPVLRSVAAGPRQKPRKRRDAQRPKR